VRRENVVTRFVLGQSRLRSNLPTSESTDRHAAPQSDHRGKLLLKYLSRPIGSKARFSSFRAAK